MNLNKRTALTLVVYGAFLILVGLIGFLSNPEKAKTALMSGGTFGLLHIGLGWLSSRGWRPAGGIALGVAVFLAIVFSWRATVSWMAVAGGQPEKLVAAVLISSMLVATLGVVGWLWRTRRRAGAEAS
jgi:uncharacterized membrane protein (UPF0136 family)